MTPVAYLWDFGDGETSIEESPSHKYTRPGKYTVSLTITYDDNTQETKTKIHYINVGFSPINGYRTNKAYSVGILLEK
jgi:PKD repeat protein